MKTYYALDELYPFMERPRLFLAGPTPRSPEVKSWREEALQYLASKAYKGIVFVPEPQNGKWHNEYDNQIAWEDKALNRSDCIMFWIPRDLDTLPGFTTNIEWGRWERSGKVVLGYPKEAPKMTYIAYYAKHYGVPIAHSLEDTIDNALNMLKEKSK